MHRRPWVVVAVIAVLAVACGSGNEATAGPALDLDALAVDVPEGRLEAAAVPGAAVGAVDDALFAAVVLDGRGSGRTVRVYLCDGRDGMLLQGPATGDEVVLEQGRTQVEVDLSADPMTASVVWRGGGAQPVTVGPTTGDAGFYWASATLDGRNLVGGWIVLEDGRQRGTYEEEEEELQM